ncbi:MAG: hypothetical protein DRH24_10050 [Deltaproteobacteria bacterium]|nr:MAG: hypothetical protein DRH24_10050 [Deltaproteobacteria bacterium]
MLIIVKNRPHFFSTVIGSSDDFLVAPAFPFPTYRGYVWPIIHGAIQLNLTSSISGSSFSRDAANKATIATYRQKTDTITIMISNILNMIDHQPIRKNNSCLGVILNLAINYRKLLAINETTEF